MLVSPELFPSRCYAERVADQGPPLARAVSEVLSRLPAHLGTAPMCWLVDPEGARPRQVSFDEATIEQLLSRAGRLTGRFQPFLLADHPTDWRFVLGCSVNPVERLEYLDLSMPGAREEQPADLAGMMELVGMVGATFGAHTAFIEDAALQNLYIGRRTVELVRARTPPDLRERVPDPGPLPGAAGTLPELLHPSEFDRSRVPQAVYWLNYWSRTQVEALGRERIEGAGWERMLASPDGALTLAATRSPPDPTRAADLERLRRIVERLELRAAQERSR